jgi:hypothetical protein
MLFSQEVVEDPRKAGTFLTRSSPSYTLFYALFSSFRNTQIFMGMVTLDSILLKEFKKHLKKMDFLVKGANKTTSVKTLTSMLTA